jgi:hypothetical protein
MLRPLLSGGKASYPTVNKDAEGRNIAEELNAEAPASITIPTVRNKLDGQLQTRMLVAELPDYEGRVAAHSRASSRLLLPDYAAKDHTPKVRAWQAALESLSELRRACGVRPRARGILRRLGHGLTWSEAVGEPNRPDARSRVA